MCKIKNVNKDIPFVILMRCLGLQTDLEIFNCVCQKDITDLSHDELDEFKGIIEIMRYSIEQNNVVT